VPRSLAQRRGHPVELKFLDEAAAFWVERDQSEQAGYDYGSKQYPGPYSDLHRISPSHPEILAQGRRHHQVRNCGTSWARRNKTAAARTTANLP
jgi:hypothetical protein